MGWESSPLADESAKRGNGNCFYYGCEEPGFIKATWRVPTPVTLHPDHKFCPRHAQQEKLATERAVGTAAMLLARTGVVRGGWEDSGTTEARRRAARAIRAREWKETEELRANRRDGEDLARHLRNVHKA